MSSYSNELKHYGVKGMKWGVRRYQNEDGTLTSAGKERYSDNDKNETKRKGLTDKQKKYIKVGAAVATTALAAYGAYKVHELYTGKGQQFDPETGFRLLNKNMTDLEHLNQINPGRIKLFNTRIKNKEIISGSSANCMLCTTTYELRKRGFDVHAGYSTTGYMPDELFSEIFKNYKGTTKIDNSLSSKDAMKNLIDVISKEGDGSRGNVMVWWGFGQGGHSMIWENVNGSIKFMDGQTGQEYKNFSKDILTYIDLKKPIEILRTDNLDLNVPNLRHVINSDTLTKTYIDHGAEVALNLASDPGIQTVAAVAFYTGSSAVSAYKERKAERYARTDLNYSNINRIKSLSSRGYTIDEISNKLGFSPSTVSKYLQ